jgi:hypothetical protein
MFFRSSDDCKACTAKDEIIGFLKEQIKQKDADWANERAEYKRTVDRLLQRERIAPIGEGVRKEVLPTAPIGISSLWDEVKTESQEAGDGF